MRERLLIEVNGSGLHRGLMITYPLSSIICTNGVSNSLTDSQHSAGDACPHAGSIGSDLLLAEVQANITDLYLRASITVGRFQLIPDLTLLLSETLALDSTFFL